MSKPKFIKDTTGRLESLWREMRSYAVSKGLTMNELVEKMWECFKRGDLDDV